jgi:hypothetical protein
MSEVVGRARKAPIALRRFAGPLVYADAMVPLRVAHLTDLHVGRVTPYWIQQAAVAMTNESKPDVVVITGDFVCHSQLYLDDLTSLLRSIEAPVYAVLGNHDHWAGGAEVKRAILRGGAELLENRFTVFESRGEKLQIVGLDDAYTGHADRAAATRGLSRHLPTLGLSHIAEEADSLWPLGIPLVLSGHTHAGQITLARLHELAIGRVGGHKYVHGLYGTRSTVDRSGTPPGAVYVGAGIGASVMPVRLGERGRREITLFEYGTRVGTFDEHHREQAPLPGRKPTEAEMEKRRKKVADKAKRREQRSNRGRS